MKISTMKKNLCLAALLGIFAVVLGAFGAHVLKEKISATSLQSFETGVRYQLFHVLLLLFVNTYSGFSTRTKNIISFLIFGGIFLFSGSIYAISIGLVSASSIWLVTPLGGFLFIIGWLWMLSVFLKKENTN